MDPLAISTRMEDRWGVLEDMAFHKLILIAEEQELLSFRNHMDRVPNTSTAEEWEAWEEAWEVAWEVVSAAPILTACSLILIYQVIKRIVRVPKEASAHQEVACKVQENQEVKTSKCPPSPTKWLLVA